jgi:hypothetical protein
MSDSHNRLMVDFCHLRNGGVMVPAGSRRCGSEVHAMTVSAQFRFFGCWTLVVRIISFGKPGQDVGQLAGCPNCHLRYQMTR